MADREPFVYPDWCTGPSVDIDMPAGFPVCDDVVFTRPTYLHVPRIDPPDIDPPPFCPCIPTMRPSTGSTYDFGGDRSTMDIKIVPMTADCCNPEFKIDFDIEVPCMPFELAATAKFTAGATYATKPNLNIRKVTGTCKFEFNLRLPPSGGGDAVELCLYEHGEGVQFVTCCQGVGYIGLDATMRRKTHGTLQINMIHQVNVKIPLLAALQNYSTSHCSHILGATHGEIYDPWGNLCSWLGTGNSAASNFSHKKYCCSKTTGHPAPPP